MIAYGNKTQKFYYVDFVNFNIEFLKDELCDFIFHTCNHVPVKKKQNINPIQDVGVEAKRLPVPVFPLYFLQT